MPAEKKYTAAESAERHRQRVQERMRQITAAGQEIGEIPPPEKPERRELARLDFQAFCEQYFPLTFTMGWSKDHLEVLQKIQKSVVSGGLFAMAMPRASGKTTICEIACLWSALYGHRRYVVIIGATQGMADGNLESIKRELEVNELLAEDFPEVCLPIGRLDGQVKRAIGQKHNGHRTHILWTSDRIVLPTIEGAASSGCIIESAGLTGSIRGLLFKRADGASVRPDLVMIDDPQTDESARSMSQCETRERLLSGAVLGLAGPGRKIAGVMPCTVIRSGDMADRILDRAIHPEWGGLRMKMVYQFPANDSLWDQYAEVRKKGLENDEGIAEATAFYAANREAMDAGAIVAWESRYNPDEISAIQHAMNLKFQDERSFFSEYQNEPLPEDDVEELDLTVDQIAGKINRLKRHQVADGVQRITAFIDVQKSLLYYLVAAWEDDFTGYVIDYGSWPDQKKPYFALRGAKNTIQVQTGEASLESQLTAGLQACTDNLVGRVYSRDDGADMRIDKLLIDANWGESTDIIYNFCRKSRNAAIIQPSHGKFVGASSMPFGEYVKRQGDRVGDNWRVPSVRGRSRVVRHCVFDSNYWKTFVHTRFAVSDGGRGAVTLWGSKPQEHRMFAEHMTSEYRVVTEGRGRKVSEWKLRVGAVDNHLLDCMAGAAVAASMCGVTLKELARSPSTTKPQKSMADLQREAREARTRKK